MKIFLSVATALLLIGCSGDTEQKSEPVKPAPEKQEVVKQELPIKAERPIEETLEENGGVIIEKKEITATTPVPAPEVQNIAKKPKTIAPEPLVDGKALYKACVSCHGADASKKALNKSQVIQGWSSQKIEDALAGYKEGTYGGSMKTLMQGQVKKLSEAEIKALADYISKL